MGLIESHTLELGQCRCGPYQILDLPPVDPVLAAKPCENLCMPPPGQTTRVEAAQEVFPDGGTHDIVEQLEMNGEVDSALKRLVEFSEAVRREKQNAGVVFDEAQEDC